MTDSAAVPPPTPQRLSSGACNYCSGTGVEGVTVLFGGV
jgi:hypothetical protein